MVSVEYLKQLIMDEIEAQNKASIKYSKILRRLSVLLFGILFLLVSIMFAFGYVIYLENQPQSEVNKALKSIQGLETRISLQREYINLNTEKLNQLDTVKYKK